MNIINTKILAFAMGIICVLIMLTDAQSQSVGIGDGGEFTPDNSALLEMQSTLRGFLMPRMTEAQKNAIVAPVHGLMIIQTDGLSGLWYYYDDGFTQEWRQLVNYSNSVAFGDIQTGTNNSATMTVAAGASILLDLVSPGVVEASAFVGTGSVSAAVDLNTGEVSGILPITGGGTGLSLAPATGGILYSSNGTSYSSSPTPTANGQVLVYNLATNEWLPQDFSPLSDLPEANIWVGDGNDDPVARTMSQDGTLSNAGALTVTGLQARPVSNTLPTNGQVLTFDGTNWAPSDPTLSSLTDANIWVGDGNDDPVARTMSQDGTLSNTGALTVKGLHGRNINDITPPVNGQVMVFDGTEWQYQNASSGGTVTEVGLSLPSPEFNITVPTVTNSGTLTAVWKPQNQNLVFASPSGIAGTPSFRAIVSDDIPGLDASKITTGILPIIRGGTGASAVNTFGVLYGNSDGTAYVSTASGTTGQILVATTGAAPTWQTFNPWNLTGNSGTDPATNYLGTSDNQPLVLRTNATEKLRITSAGNVGIGEITPTQKLEIKDGNLALTNTGAATEIRLFEPSASGTDYTAFKSVAQTANIIYRLPNDKGAVNNVLMINNSETDGATLKWGDPLVISSPYAAMTTHYANSSSTTLTPGYGFYRIESNGQANQRNLKIFNGSYNGQTIYIASVSSGNVGFSLDAGDSNLRIMANNLTFGTYAACAMVWDGAYWYMLSKPNN